MFLFFNYYYCTVSVFKGCYLLLFFKKVLAGREERHEGFDIHRGLHLAQRAKATV